MTHSDKHLDTYEQQLLDGWEDVYKKSQLTLWILLALKDGPKHMSHIKDFIAKSTKGTLEADDKSMYRALRRYNEGQLIDFVLEAGEGGPDRKQYYLTESGIKVLNAFTNRQIIDILYSPAVRKLVEQTAHEPPVQPQDIPIQPDITEPESSPTKGSHGKLATQI